MTAVPPEEVKAVWPKVAPMLAPAVQLSNSRIDMASVFEWLQDRRYVLWVAIEDHHSIRASFVTREARYPKKSMLCIDIAGGSDMAEWVSEADRVFRAYARAAGLDGIELYGRAGWTRALKNLGWTGGTVLLETNLVAGG